MKTEWKIFLRLCGSEWINPDAPLADFNNLARELSLPLSGEATV